MINERQTQSRSADDTAATTRAILRGDREVRLIAHRSDGWQLLDGGPVDPKDMAIVHLAHFIEAHPELSAHLDLPLGWETWRDDASDAWFRAELPTDLS